MARLEDVDVGELEAALEDAEGPREAQRLLVAIIYKRGPSVPMLAEWLDAREATIYRWFDRIESEPIERAVSDRDRPGRPRRLDDAERAAFERALAGPPSDVGYEHESWSTALAQHYLEEAFDVAYSRRHVQRLVSERDAE